MKAIHKEKHQKQDRDVATLCLTIMIMFMVMTMYETTSILFTVFSRTETREGRKPFMPMTHRSHFQEMSDAEVYPQPPSPLPATQRAYLLLSQRAESERRSAVSTDATEAKGTMRGR